MTVIKKKGFYESPEVEIVLSDVDVVTASGPIELPVIPASVSDSDLFNLK